MTQHDIDRIGGTGSVLFATSFALGFFLCSVGCSQVGAIIPGIGFLLSAILFLIAYCESAEHKFRQPTGYETADRAE